MTYDTYKHRYKHHGGRRLTSVGLAQARPNKCIILYKSEKLLSSTLTGFGSSRCVGCSESKVPLTVNI